MSRKTLFDCCPVYSIFLLEQYFSTKSTLLTLFYWFLKHIPKWLKINCSLTCFQLVEVSFDWTLNDYQNWYFSIKILYYEYLFWFLSSDQPSWPYIPWKWLIRPDRQTARLTTWSWPKFDMIASIGQVWTLFDKKK